MKEATSSSSLDTAVRTAELQAIPLWASVLDSSSESLKGDKGTTRRCGLFASPPPTIFKQSTHRYRFMLNYLRGRDNLQAFISSPSAPLSKLRSDDWRLGLLGEVPKRPLTVESTFES